MDLDNWELLTALLPVATAVLLFFLGAAARRDYYTFLYFHEDSFLASLIHWRHRIWRTFLGVLLAWMMILESSLIVKGVQLGYVEMARQGIERANYESRNYNYPGLKFMGDAFDSLGPMICLFLVKFIIVTYFIFSLEEQYAPITPKHFLIGAAIFYVLYSAKLLLEHAGVIPPFDVGTVLPRAALNFRIAFHLICWFLIFLWTRTLSE